MRFEWDEAKNEANIRKHGFDFVDAELLLRGPVLVNIDDREDYGEDRWLAIGALANRVAVVVYTERSGDVVRIISMRKATTYERRGYEGFLAN